MGWEGRGERGTEGRQGEGKRKERRGVGKERKEEKKFKSDWGGADHIRI